MDTPQSQNSQNIFQVEEVGSGEPQNQQVSQGSELSPNFPTTPSEPGFDDTPGGNPLFRILIILLVIVLVAVVIYFGYRFFSSRGSGSNGPVSLTYWGLWEDEAIMQPIIDEYQNQNPNVTISYIFQTPKQYRERLEAAIQRGGEVDIFRYHNTWVPMLKDKLAPLPESVMAKKEYEATFYPVTKTDLNVSGNYVGIPLMIDGLGLFANTDILKASGVADPKTWDDVQIASDTLKVIPPDGKIRTGGIALGTAGNVEHFSDIMGLMMMQNGANLSNPTSPEATDALAYYRLYAEEPSRVWDETMPNSILAFAQGQVAMIFAPSWEALAIKAINPDLNFKVIPVPQLKDAPPVTWASYWVEGVANNSPNQKAAWEFLKYLSSKEVMTQLYTNEANIRGFGEPYSRTDLAQSLTSDPIVGAYIIQAPQARSFPLASKTHDNGLNDRMIKYLEDGINSVAQGASPQSAMQTVAQGFQQVLGQYGLAAAAASPTP
ncbi:sugar ABC transporter substrate-binding protein [Candidatus Gottesmanbacteria bacterium]|nr:sugar ABC transporter substrate-binding protein [Candidatus Gottesmanbacteria bacterium]